MEFFEDILGSFVRLGAGMDPGMDPVPRNIAKLPGNFHDLFSNGEQT
jgi:hypothetical protein